MSGLKSLRNLYIAVTIFAAGCCAAVGLGNLIASDTTAAVSDNYAGPTGLPGVACLVGAAAVVFLGWHLVKLASGVSGVVESLSGDRTDSVEASTDALPPTWSAERFTAALNRAIGQRLERPGENDRQLDELQLQLQLSDRQKRNAEAIIYSIRDAVIVVDEFGKVVTANESAGKLMGFGHADAVHKPIGELVGADKSGFVEFLIHTMKIRQQAAKQEMVFEDRHGRKVFDCTASCVYDGNKQVCGVVAVLHDITREKEISQMKNDFVSHVSHELKTPLASITAYSEMLAEGEAEDEETRKEFCTIIQKQAHRLNRLIEDILNISRIESGLIKVDKKPQSLMLLIEEQLQMIKGYAEEKNIKIVGQQPIVFDQVNVDRDMMAQVIVNLLSNAVKYTPAGGTVTVSTEVDEIARTARVTVTDTGVGIPEEEIDYVFDKFYRVDANKAQAKGTGLGLNLVKQIVEKVHNGKVFVTSKPGQGSTFGFELPLAKAQPVGA